MKCKHCGFECKDTDKFCKNCGTKFETSKNYLLSEVKRAIIWLIIIFLSMLLAIKGLCYWTDITIAKEPYNISYRFGDTDTHIYANYNDKYKTINLQLVVDEVIEEWQIEANKELTTEITITCIENNIGKKEFKFDNIKLIAGQKLKGYYTIENAELNDFVLIKDILEKSPLFGNVSINYSSIFQMDSSKREELKQQHYRQKKRFKTLFNY